MALIGEMNYLTIGDKTYEIADEAARTRQLTATYTAATMNLAIDVESVEDSEND